MSDKPWTLRQLQAAMRKQGYRRVDGPGSGYIHTQTGKKVELTDYDEKTGRGMAGNEGAA